MTLQGAVDSLYALAVVEKKSTSTLRMRAMAEHLCAEIEARGLPGARPEVRIPGGGREKDWDIGWEWAGKCRLVISLKSILKNLAGTVPNRIDDLMGETANVQLYSPEIVAGYVMVLDAGQDGGTRAGSTREQVLRDRLARLSGRRAPYWVPGMFESHAVVTVDFTAGPRILRGEDEVGSMLDALVAETRKRNPGITGGKEP